MSDLKDLSATVEDLRSKKYEALPSALVHEILAIEAEALDSSKASRQIERAVDKWLSEKGTE